MLDKDCGIRTTFSQSFVTEKAASGATEALVMAVGEGVVANAKVEKNGRTTVEATFNCQAYRASRGGVESVCLLDALATAGLKFPRRLRSKCLHNQGK